MSYLLFYRQTHRLTLFSDKGQHLGTWEAYNNVTNSSNGIWPNGEYTYSHYNSHAGLGIDSSYGTKGIFVFNVAGRTGMGVHAGRKNSTDGKGRSGPAYNTLGCIRTTEAAMSTIKSTHASDPLTDITVSEGLIGDFPTPSSEYAYA